MKTSMQELIDKLEYLQRTNPNKLFIEQGIHHGLEAAIKEAKSMLEKEKEQMCEFADEFAIECINFHHEKTMSQEKFFDLTFNTNEK